MHAHIDRNNEEKKKPETKAKLYRTLDMDSTQLVHRWNRQKQKHSYPHGWTKNIVGGWTQQREANAKGYKLAAREG